MHVLQNLVNTTAHAVYVLKEFLKTNSIIFTFAYAGMARSVHG